MANVQVSVNESRVSLCVSHSRLENASQKQGQGWGDGSVCTQIAALAQGPDCGSPDPIESWMFVYACNPAVLQ